MTNRRLRDTRHGNTTGIRRRSHGLRDMRRADPNAKGDRLVCLLRTGLDKPVVEIKPDTSLLSLRRLRAARRGWTRRPGRSRLSSAAEKVLDRIDALKVIGFWPLGERSHLKTFSSGEAEAAASLEHPQIVPIYEIGERRIMPLQHEIRRKAGSLLRF